MRGGRGGKRELKTGCGKGGGPCGSREPREEPRKHLAEMVGLYRNEKLGKGNGRL